jgi:hypothetical protein
MSRPCWSRPFTRKACFLRGSTFTCSGEIVRVVSRDELRAAVVMPSIERNQVASDLETARGRVARHRPEKT